VYLRFEVLAAVLAEDLSLLGCYTVTTFDVFLTVHHSTDLFQITNLMHNSFIL